MFFGEVTIYFDQSEIDDILSYKDLHFLLIIHRIIIIFNRFYKIQKIKQYEQKDPTHLS